jgi:hypothetical protein
MKQYRSAKDADKGQDYFAQGFRLGLFFGIFAALIILGRNNK